MKRRFPPADRALSWILIAATCASTAQGQEPDRHNADSVTSEWYQASDKVYVSESWARLYPQHAILVLLPRGDTLVFANITVRRRRTNDERAVCAPERGERIVTRARVAIGLPAGPRWAQDFLEAGEARVYHHWELPLPSGDTLVITEIYRRRDTCEAGDGVLFVFFTIRPRPSNAPRS